MQRRRPFAVHREPGQHQVRRTVIEHRTLLRFLDGQQLERDLRVSFAPHPRPLVGCYAGHECDAEPMHRVRIFANIRETLFAAP
jgi:hypothetical protein